MKYLQVVLLVLCSMQLHTIVAAEEVSAEEEKLPLQDDAPQKADKELAHDSLEILPTEQTSQPVVNTPLTDIPVPPLPPESIPLVEENQPQEFTLSGPLTGKTIQQALTQLLPLIMSRSVEKAVEQFSNLPADQALEILEQLIKTSKTNFTKKNKGRPFEIKRNDFLQIIFGVASQYRDVNIYNQFFNVIAQYPGLEYGIRPLLFVLSISSYPVLIPDLISWLEKKGYTDIVHQTALYAIDRTSTRSIRALATYAPGALKPFLGPLLLYAISQKKPLTMIAALIDSGAEVNYPDASGYTPLIKAVEMANLPVTQLLVQKGADIDLIIKDEVGSAWQKSSELSKTSITEYLKAHAAKQDKKLPEPTPNIF